MNDMETIESASATIKNEIYAAASFFEDLEDAGKIRGNGHHMRQHLAQDAADMLADRWIDRADDHEKAMQRARDYISGVRSIEKFNRSWSDLARTYSGTMVIVDVDQGFRRSIAKYLDLWTWRDELRYQLRRLFWA